MKFNLFKRFLIIILLVSVFYSPVVARTLHDSISKRTYEKDFKSVSNSLVFGDMSKSYENKNLKNPFNELEYKLGFISPFSGGKDFSFKKSFALELEILVPFLFYKNFNINTGIEMQYGKTNLSHTINKLVWVESLVGMFPYQITNQYLSKYLGFGVPVYLETASTKSSFPINFVFCAGMGYQFYLDIENKYELSENNTSNTFYFNTELGLKVRLLKMKRISFNILPSIGYNSFLHNHNNLYKKNYPFFKLSLTLKKLTNE